MIVILNGPAGSGKDTIGGILGQVHGWGVESFKAPMWEVAKATLGESLFRKFEQDYASREYKEKPLAYLGGISPRQFFIRISEEWCKPTFGQRYFGNRMADTLLSYPGAKVITDGGFPAEVEPLAEVGLHVVIVRLHREGFDFDGDSRSYIRDDAFLHIAPLLRPHFLDIELVEGKPELASAIIRRYVRG